jgi:hypothetical protein
LTISHHGSTCAHLTSLDLSDNTIGAGEGADALAKCVGALPHARTLRLGDLGLEAEGVAKVCAGILASASSATAPLALEELDLSFNEIGAEDGAHALSALLARTPKLRVLQLECNELSSTGVAIVVAPLAAASHADVASLTLLDNEISSSGALAVCGALKTKTGASALRAKAAALASAAAFIAALALSAEPRLQLRSLPRKLALLLP